MDHSKPLNYSEDFLLLPSLWRENSLFWHNLVETIFCPALTFVPYWPWGSGTWEEGHAWPAPPCTPPRRCSWTPSADPGSEAGGADGSTSGETPATCAESTGRLRSRSDTTWEVFPQQSGTPDALAETHRGCVCRWWCPRVRAPHCGTWPPSGLSVWLFRLGSVPRETDFQLPAPNLQPGSPPGTKHRLFLCLIGTGVYETRPCRTRGTTRNILYGFVDPLQEFKSKSNAGI